MARSDGSQIQPWAKPRYTDTQFAEEERTCWQLRLRGQSLRQIAAETGLSKSTVENRLRAAYVEYREDTAALRDQYIQMELERLDAAQLAVVAVLDAEHLVISEGHVVRLNGVPLSDPGPVLAAVREFRMLSESRRRLLGLDAPSTSRVEVTAISALDAEVWALEEELRLHAGDDAVPPE